MPRACLMPDAHTPEAALAEAWLRKWRRALLFRSDDLGCGCCVHIWRVEAPAHALDELPDTVLGNDEWSMERDTYVRR